MKWLFPLQRLLEGANNWLGNMAFKVVNVIDGDTFEVMPPWKWKDQSGIRVRPTGYNIPEEGQKCQEIL